MSVMSAAQSWLGAVALGTSASWLGAAFLYLNFRLTLSMSNSLGRWDCSAAYRRQNSGARLKMEQDRRERERGKTEEEVVAHFQRWVKNPEVRDLVCQNWI